MLGAVVGITHGKVTLAQVVGTFRCLQQLLGLQMGLQCLEQLLVFHMGK